MSTPAEGKTATKSWKDPGDPPALPATGDVDRIEVEVELITPMFGGGVEPRTADPQGWLRPASVKGQLRFWWRALYAPSFTSIKELWQAEGRLFGSPARFEEVDGKERVAGGPGLVRVAVNELRTATLKEKRYPETPKDISMEYGNRGFLLFPAQKNPTKHLSSAYLLNSGATAKLTLTLATEAAENAAASQVQEDRQQVLRALGAWLTLGGVGARTRRGIGALALKGVAPAGLVIPTTANGLVDYVRGFSTGARPEYASHFFLFAGSVHEVCVGPEEADAIKALEKLANAWKMARQERPSKGKGTFGRSKWPEADTVRRIAGTYARWSDGTMHTPAPNVSNSAPRARLGLPIGIKFIDAERSQRKIAERGEMIDRDPLPVEITHEQGDRFASPVLLCVVRIAKHFVPVVIATYPTLPYRATLAKTPIDKTPNKITDKAILDRVLSHFKKLDFRKVFPS